MRDRSQAVRSLRWFLFPAIVLVALVAACSPSAVEPSGGAGVSSEEPAGGLPSPLATALPSIAPALGDVCQGTVGQTASREVPVGSGTRTVRIHRPVSAQPDATLIIALHGYGQTAAEMEEESGLSATADKDGFIVVYPQGAGDPPAWGIDPASALYKEDAAFLAGLATAFGEGGCADPGWTAVVGFSWGAFMANALACTGADWAVAVAPVAAGGLTGAPCDPPIPVPIVAFNGDADTTIPYAGGPVTFPDGTKPLVDPSTDWATAWAKRNACVDEPATSTVEPDLDRLSWSDCQAAVTLYTVKGGQHAWPDAANDLIWEFIGALPRLR